MGEPPRVIDLDEVPQELRAALSISLNRKPDSRYQTALEFRDSLLGCVRSAAPEVAVFGADSRVFDVTACSVVGKCPKCQSQSNTSRSFCLGCGESLRVSYASCSVDIPVWENFCWKCDGNQKELLATKVSKEKRPA